jgi:uncharacterized protein (DUF1015 family)
MAFIAPFRGLLYNPRKISDLSDVIAPPYDVITPEEQEKLYQKSPYNIVRLILNRDPDCYASVVRTFEQWQTESVLVRDEHPAVYFMRHRFSLKDETQKERLGFVALIRMEDPSSGAIRPHEKTLDEPKEDRFRLLQACGANLSQIFALYADPQQNVNGILREHVGTTPPLFQAADGGGGSCLFWRITDEAVIQRLQREMADKVLLIADGHHRYEAAMRYRDFLRAKTENLTGRESFNYVMMYLANLADDSVVILPTHRLLRALPAVPNLEEALRRYFYLEAYPKTAEGRQWFLKALKNGAKKQPLIGAAFGRDPRYLILRVKNKRTMQRLARTMNPTLRELDVTILHLLVFEQVLGLSPKEQIQGNTLSYLHDEDKALQAVESGACQAAFILNPPRAEEALTVALQGEKMPQKSTYFYPKLPTGLVINKIIAGEEVAGDGAVKNSA